MEFSLRPVRAQIPPWPPSGFVEHPNAKNERKEIDMSMKDVFQEKGGGPPMLHGSDVPAKQNSITIKVKELREAPKNFSGIAIVDLAEEVFGKKAWAVNKSNFRILMDKFGFDEEAEFEDIARKVQGKKLTLSIVMVNDPTKNKFVRGLAIYA